MPMLIPVKYFNEIDKLMVNFFMERVNIQPFFVKIKLHDDSGFNCPDFKYN